MSADDWAIVISLLAIVLSCISMGMTWHQHRKRMRMLRPPLGNQPPTPGNQSPNK